ncbi:pentatricopeptide repeat-containing protein At2g17033 [Andrographis paniculata]|uniref:pentatricopeptide repeat-containing protein At2g17033 n=1 Tax=Andrographis paniculata TaxID=175694 RepID=UPI0021E9080B|nr:pentatricopeptide repeat-containing protein At2g17033 [Andrographis paniculata]
MIRVGVGGRAVIGVGALPPVVCGLTKQGHRFLTSLAIADPSSAAVGLLLRKFVSSTSKHVALTTLSHLLSPSTTSHSRLYSSIALPLYTVIKQEPWFSWNGKLVADLIAFLYKQGRYDESEELFAETIVKLGLRERELCIFLCHLVESHGDHKSQKGVFLSSEKLGQLLLHSRSGYVKRRGYASMVAGFCEIGLPDKAEALIGEMREIGLKPSAFEFKSIVYGYGQMGFLQEMKRVVTVMEGEGYELDTVCCNMVLASFGEHGELLDMLWWLKKMRDSGIPFSIRTYNSVLNACPTVMAMIRDTKKLPLMMDELVASLKRDEADVVLELLKSNVLDQVMEWKASELSLDLHGMHLSSVYLVLMQWFGELRRRFAAGNFVTPADVLVICGVGRHSSTRGESPVRNLAKEIVVRMECPLRIDRKNIGCFIGKGSKLKDWLTMS